MHNHDYLKDIKNNKIDLNHLPDHVKQELIDYYTFLIKRHGIKQTGKRKLSETFHNPLKVNEYIKFKRDDIYNAR